MIVNDPAAFRMCAEKGRRRASEQPSSVDHRVEVAGQVRGDGEMARLKLGDLGELRFNDGVCSGAGERDGVGSES